MEKSSRKQIEEIIDGLKCPKNFKCAKRGFEHLCRARDIGMESFLECLEKDPHGCKFSLLFGHRNFCQCPLRVYISKNLQR